jgi:hypothetical protein
MLLARREAVLEEGLPPLGSLDGREKAGKSEEPRGEETVEMVAWLFLRRGGKYPRVCRGMRAISTGLEEGKESN